MNALRFADDRDAWRIAEIYAPFVLDSWTSFEELAPDANEIAARIRKANGEYPWIVASDETDRTIAYAYASAHRERGAYRWSVDVSVYVDAAYRRCGTARRLYTALFAILAIQGYVRAFAGISLPNDASVGFHRSAGFETIAIYRNVGFKAGAWRDTMWLARALCEPPDPPTIPIRLTTLDPCAIARIFAEA